MPEVRCRQLQLDRLPSGLRAAALLILQTLMCCEVAKRFRALAACVEYLNLISYKE
jgi:hypothetical protein